MLQKTKAADPLLHTMRPRSSRTEFIANVRGYLETSKVRKLGNSFNHQPKLQVYEGSPAQWPKRNPCVNSGSSATMGYKGIPTSYLMGSTVGINAVEIPGCKERHYT
eukprot:jgi/Astpho2/9673/e_gw1.00146.162.1_t